MATCPSSEVPAQFEALSSGIIQQIENLVSQSHHLSTLRDWLLPMLMNGQVQVGEAEVVVGEAWSMAAEGEGAYRAKSNNPN
jgi:type I restriction enzyme S subunit